MTPESHNLLQAYIEKLASDLRKEKFKNKELRNEITEGAMKYDELVIINRR